MVCHVGHCSIGALGDSFFEYLVKSWIGTSEKDIEAKDMYFKTAKVSMFKVVAAPVFIILLCDGRIPQFFLRLSKNDID